MYLYLNIFKRVQTLLINSYPASLLSEDNGKRDFELAQFEDFSLLVSWPMANGPDTLASEGRLEEGP